MLLENASSLMRTNGFINQLHINYIEGWTSGDVHYYNFVKAEKDEKLHHKSSLVFFSFLLLAQESPSLASSQANPNPTS